MLFVQQLTLPFMANSPKQYLNLSRRWPQPKEKVRFRQHEYSLTFHLKFTILTTNWTIQQEILLENTFYYWDS